MAYISKKERDAIPAESFGDPEGRRFPIRNQQDLDDAAHLIGKAGPGVKKRIIAIARRKGLKLPDSWKADANMSEDGGEATPDQLTATFAMPGTSGRPEGDDVVYDDALLFRAGSYPDHGIDVSPEDLAAAVAAFDSAVGGSIEHTQFLRGRACRVDEIRLDPSDPTALRGTVRVPRWLDERLEDAEKKLSSEWDIPTKTLKGLSLCVEPAITDAALVAAFARHHTRHGRQTMQVIHDMCASSGALCAPTGQLPPEGAAFIAKHERMALQTIHDHAVKHGASCSGRAMFSASKPGAPSATPRARPMSWIDKLKAAVGVLPATDREEPTPADLDALFTAISKAEGTEPDPKAAPKTPVARATVEGEDDDDRADFTRDPRWLEHQAELRELRAESVRAKAEQWADGEIKAERSLKRDRPALIAQFVLADADDAADPATARFTAATKVHDRADFSKATSRLAFLKAVHAARPRHVLFGEYLREEVPEGADAEALFTIKPDPAPSRTKADPKELAELRGHSTLLAAHKANGADKT
jgi:hypothetical protein